MSQGQGKQFKVGDVVQLKSGGPQMTVKNYGQYGYNVEEECLCVWFEKDTVKEAVFAEALLKKANEAVGAVNVGLI